MTNIKFHLNEIVACWLPILMGLIYALSFWHANGLGYGDAGVYFEGLSDGNIFYRSPLLMLLAPLTRFGEPFYQSVMALLPFAFCPAIIYLMSGRPWIASSFAFLPAGYVMLVNHTQLIALVFLLWLMLAIRKAQPAWIVGLLSILVSTSHRFAGIVAASMLFFYSRIRYAIQPRLGLIWMLAILLLALLPLYFMLFSWSGYRPLQYLVSSSLPSLLTFYGITLALCWQGMKMRDVDSLAVASVCCIGLYAAPIIYGAEAGSVARILVTADVLLLAALSDCFDDNGKWMLVPTFVGLMFFIFSVCFNYGLV